MASKAGDIRQGHGSGDSSQGFVVGMSPDNTEYASDSCRGHGSSGLAGWFWNLVFPACGMRGLATEHLLSPGSIR